MEDIVNPVQSIKHLSIQEHVNVSSVVQELNQIQPLQIAFFVNQVSIHQVMLSVNHVQKESFHLMLELIDVNFVDVVDKLHQEELTVNTVLWDHSLLMKDLVRSV
jgi:hypothetical protein